MCQEIYDMIVDNVAADAAAKKDLYSCMLAFRALVPRTRTHLYSTLRLKPRTDIKQLETLYTSVQLLPYVRDISICGCLMVGMWGEDDRTGLRGDTYEPDHAWICDLIPFLTRFKDIQTLQLIDLSWGDVPQDARSFLLSHFTSATRLRLDLVDFWNSNQLLRMLQAFPRLSWLSTECLSYHKGTHTLRQISSTEPLRLHTLELRNTDCARYRPLVNWLVGSRTDLTVDNAFVQWDDTDVESLVALFRAIASSLQILSFELSSRASRMGQDVGDGDVPPGYVDDMHDDELAVDTFLDDDEDDVPHVDMPITDCSIDLADDEAEEHRNPAFDEEFKTFADEASGNRVGATILESDPIRDSALAEITARIQWSPMVPFAIQLLTQLISPHTTIFVLRITFPPLHHWQLVDWSALNSILATVNARPDGATFQLKLLVPHPMSDIQHTLAKSIVQQCLRTVLGRGVFWIYVMYESTSPRPDNCAPDLSESAGVRVLG